MDQRTSWFSANFQNSVNHQSQTTNLCHDYNTIRQVRICGPLKKPPMLIRRKLEELFKATQSTRRSRMAWNAIYFLAKRPRGDPHHFARESGRGPEFGRQPTSQTTWFTKSWLLQTWLSRKGTKVCNRMGREFRKVRGWNAVTIWGDVTTLVVRWRTSSLYVGLANNNFIHSLP
jgi:hypothetical protein